MPLPFYEDKDSIERPKDTEEVKPPDKLKRKGFREALNHAFSMKVADDEFNPDDMALIDRVAGEIVKRRMATPALLFLESIRPISFLASQAMYMLRPFIIAATLGNPASYERFVLLMEKSEGMEKFILSIEKQEDARVKELRSKNDKE